MLVPEQDIYRDLYTVMTTMTTRLYDAALGYHINCTGSGIFHEDMTGHTLFLLIHGVQYRA